jgi:quaternary ammonium compound-resistance protein SugE
MSALRPETPAEAWTLLVVAAVLETAFAVSLKFTRGFTRPGPSLATTALAVASMVTLARSLAVLPVGTAYAAWTGLGAVGAVVLGIVLFGEPLSVRRLVAVGMVVGGVVGLRFGGLSR